MTTFTRYTATEAECELARAEDVFTAFLAAMEPHLVAMRQVQGIADLEGFRLGMREAWRNELLNTFPDLFAAIEQHEAA